MKWVIELLIFASGVGVGMLIHYWGWNKSTEIKRLMRDYNQLNRDHRELQTSIDDYFGKTNHLIGELNNTYDALQDHFQSGIETLGKRASMKHQLSAQQLDDGDNASTALSPLNTERSNQIEEEQSADSQSSAPFSPPKDYAPKEGADQGTLSESFGLKHT